MGGSRQTTARKGKQRMKDDVIILAIESSCDETAASVVKNGREVLSNVIYSQIALHTEYGGVVPEIASRKHIEKINQVIEQALEMQERQLSERMSTSRWTTLTPSVNSPLRTASIWSSSDLKFLWWKESTITLPRTRS